METSASNSEPTADQMTPSLTEKSSSFGSDVLKLASGATIAQALSVLMSPILSRLYPPDAFGTAAVFISITSIIGVVACLRYELAIMLPERDEDAANILAVSLVFVLIVTGLSAIFVAIARTPIVQLLNAPRLAPYLWLVPFSVLATGAFTAFNYWNLRTKHFGRLSIVRVAQAMTVNGAQLGRGIGGQAHAGGLIGSRVMGIVVVMAILVSQIWRDDRRTFVTSIRPPRMVKWMKRHRKFPLITSWSALLNVASWQLPPFLLSFFFSPTIVGYYALGQRTLRLPMNLVGNAIARVFYQRASETHTMGGDLTDVVIPVFRRLVAFGFFPMLLLALVGQDLFVVVFGPKWSEAGVYVQILSPWMFFVFISSPLSTLVSVLELQEIGLVLNALLFLTRLAALGIGGFFGSVRLALILFGGTGILVYGGMCVWIFKISGTSTAQARRILSKHVGISMVLTLPIAALKFFSTAGSQTTLLSGLISCGVYAAFLLREEKDLVRTLRRLA